MTTVPPEDEQVVASSGHADAELERRQSALLADGDIEVRKLGGRAERESARVATLVKRLCR